MGDSDETADSVRKKLKK